jgi:LuxR family maltose regulon positive regulatory protein
MERKEPLKLLSTKLAVPALRSRLVARSRLFHKLNLGLDCGFVLISAPAGYGKSTLLSAWLNRVKYANAWLTLDEADNDPVRFLAYLAAALHKVDPASGESLEVLLQSSPLPAPENLLTPLINRVSQLEKPFWLVLDDYHLIRNQAIHEVIIFLLDHRPTAFHLVIATRADPPLPLSRMRARFQMIELRLDDLRFLTTEIEEFFDQVIGLELSKEDLALLETSTEGWVAGLQMAGLSLQGRADVSEYIRSFSGENRYVLDFLFNEVFRHQRADLQNFLLQTSILERLSGSLCDKVVMREDSQSILETLERSNLFVMMLDEQREWYRYHHLFSDLLRQRLQHTQADVVPDLHLRASEWHEENGGAAEAIAHAFSSMDFKRTARLIEGAADSSLLHGEVKTFLSWVESLADEILFERPLLCVYYAEALLLSGRPMGDVASRLDGTPEFDAIKALFASYQGDAELSKNLSRRALENLPEESVFLRAVITSALGAVLLLSGDVEPAIRAFESAAQIARRSGNLLVEVIALCRLGQLHQLGGELKKSEGLFQRALDLSSDQHGSYLPVASMPLMMLANLRREWNSLDSALNLVQKAVELSHESGGFWSVDSSVVHAFVLQARGDTRGALEAIRKARELALRTEANRFDDIYTAAYEARIFLACRDHYSAVSWVGQIEPTQPRESENRFTTDGLSQSLFHLSELERMTVARVNIAQGEAEEALAILRPLVQECEDRGRRASVIENLVLQATAFNSQGKKKEAFDTLEAALSLAEPAGYVRVFLDEGETLRGLLIQLAADWQRGTTQGSEQSAQLKRYLARLIAADGDPGGRLGSLQTGRGRTEWDLRQSGSPETWPVESLTGREIDVLELLAQGFSDKKIAETLVIARGTVHKHLKNIYGKLDVHSRAEAVVRARELGLV